MNPYEVYEEFKRILRELPISQEEYEQACKEFAEMLGI